MRVILIAILILVSTVVRADASLTKGLCDKPETTYFACKTTKQKWIALCGKAPETLQYRFGCEGYVEFSFPQKASEGVEKLLFAHYARYQTDRVEISFSNKSIDYVIFNYMEDADHRAGVRVTTPEGKEHEFICIGKVTERLVELKAILRCDADNVLTGGSCSP